MALQDADLDHIRTRFLQMCVRAESMVRLAIRSVVERDPVLGRAVVASDVQMDQLELEVDALCVSYLGRRHPTGVELRVVITVLKMVTDLERIGDLAAGIAERGIALTARPGLEAGLDLPRMGTLAADMVRTATDAFVEADADAARALLASDTEVERLNGEAFARWLEVMVAHPDQVDRALSLTRISKHVERIADHACNLAEMVVFMLEGRDVRHSS